MPCMPMFLLCCSAVQHSVILKKKLHYSLTDCINQRRKVQKLEKEDTEASLMAGGENTEMDNNQCKLEESKAVVTATAVAANSKRKGSGEEGTSNPVITSSVRVDDNESDQLDTVCDNEHDDDDDDEATKFSTGQQQSGSSPSQCADDIEDNDTMGDNTDESVQLVNIQPPRKKAKVEMKGFKEDPFVFLKEDDEHWPEIKKFYGIDDNFPADQLLVRSVGGKKRNIYLVSKTVKDAMDLIDDNHKVINTGMKVIARAEADYVGCNFRLMQEGIEAMLPFISKRKVIITQKDVVILLTRDRPFCNEFSTGTQEQLNNIEEQGCIVYIYEPSGPYSNPEDTIGCRIVLCGWKAKVSTRVQISKFDKTHYQVLCGIPPAEKDKGKKRHLEPGKEPKCREDAVATEPDDDQQTGFVGDILDVEAPQGSLDVGFI